MGVSEPLLRSLVDQLAVDGLGIFRRFSPQLLVFLALVIPALLVLLLHRRRRLRLGKVDQLISAHMALDIGLGCALIGVLLITLSRSPSGSGSRTDLIPFHPLWTALTGQIDATQVAAMFGANVLLFVPLGVLLPLRWPRLDSAAKVLLACALFAGTIESTQYLLDYGRVSQVDDVIFNALGGLIGWGLLRGALLTLRWFRPAETPPTPQV